MMEDEKLQLLIGLFGELKTGQEELKTELKTDISAVKNDIENSISTVKGNISALETKVNAGQEELRQEIKAFQERIRNIEASQAAFEERVTCTVDTQLPTQAAVWYQLRGRTGG
jgi:gas vesicle protein